MTLYERLRQRFPNIRIAPAAASRVASHWQSHWHRALSREDVLNVFRAEQLARSKHVPITHGQQLLDIVAAGFPTSPYVLRNTVQVEHLSPVAALLNKHFRVQLTVHQMDVLRHYNLWDLLHLTPVMFAVFMHAASLLRGYDITHKQEDVLRLSKQGSEALQQMSKKELQRAIRPRVHGRQPGVPAMPEPPVESGYTANARRDELSEFLSLRGKRMSQGILQYRVAWSDGTLSWEPHTLRAAHNAAVFEEYDAIYRYMTTRAAAWNRPALKNRARPSAATQRASPMSPAIPRASVYAYQGQRCGYEMLCGTHTCIDSRVYHVDHINEDPGDNRLCNLVVCCPSCHAWKSHLFKTRQDHFLRPVLVRLNRLRWQWNLAAAHEEQVLVGDAPEAWLENPDGVWHNTALAQYQPQASSSRLRTVYEQQAALCGPFRDVTPTRDKEALADMLQRSPSDDEHSGLQVVGSRFVQHFLMDGVYIEGFRAHVQGPVRSARLADHQQWSVSYADKTTGSMTTEELLPYLCESKVRSLAVGMYVMRKGVDHIKRHASTTKRVGRLLVRGTRPAGTLLYPVPTAPAPWEQRFTGMLVAAHDRGWRVLYEDGTTKVLDTFTAKLQRARFVAHNEHSDGVLRHWEVFTLPPAVYNAQLRKHAVLR